MALFLTQQDVCIEANRKTSRRSAQGLCRLVLVLLLAAWTNLSVAAPWHVDVTETQIKAIADGVLTLMSYTVLPDVTTSSLSIQNASQSDPGLNQAAFGGGFTVSREFPLYLEGTLGYSRFDPEFIASNGQEERKIPFKWNSFSATGGVGWDFPLDDRGELKLRPIFNFTLGRVTTDTAIIQALINARLDTSFDIVKDETMDAYGLGGSIMLDYEHYREDYEIDVELRYTNVQLRTFGSTSEGLRGESESNTAGVWARWRAPTGLTVLQRPLRYVLETSHTRYYGDQQGALSFDHLTSLGAGIEIDSSAYLDIISRTRLLARYVFGNNISGYSIGLAVSF